MEVRGRQKRRNRARWGREQRKFQEEISRLVVIVRGY